MVADSRLWRGVRWLVWGGAALLLLLPLAAMQFTREVDWTLLDFAVMGTMLAMVGGAYELTVRVARSNAYVVAAGVAVGTGFLTTWINLAVGIIGGENEAANIWFFGVIAVAVVGAALARLRPAGLVHAMQATAIAQAMVGVLAWATTTGHPEGYLLSAVFAAMWLASAWVFAVAARAQAGNVM
jgi:hypothetical protein